MRDLPVAADANERRLRDHFPETASHSASLTVAVDHLRQPGSRALDHAADLDLCEQLQFAIERGSQRAPSLDSSLIWMFRFVFTAYDLTWLASGAIIQRDIEGAAAGIDDLHVRIKGPETRRLCDVRTGIEDQPAQNPHREVDDRQVGMRDNLAGCVLESRGALNDKPCGAPSGPERKPSSWSSISGWKSE